MFRFGAWGGSALIDGSKTLCIRRNGSRILKRKGGTIHREDQNGTTRKSYMSTRLERVPQTQKRSH